MSYAPAISTQTSAVAAAFDAVADRYDALWSDALVGRLQRQQVWRELRDAFRPGGRILELGCGTGVDAAHFAAQRINVHAIDASSEMLRRAKARICDAGLSQRVTFELRLIEDLTGISEAGPFDGIYSNFGALNCVGDVSALSAQLARLLQPGGQLVLCILGRFCLWEAAWLLSRGQVRKGLRRLSGKAAVSLESSTSFPVHYHSIAGLERMLAGHFVLRGFRGIGVFVPPSYAEPWARKHPLLVGVLASLDRSAARLPVLRASADHRLLFFERRA